MIIIKRKEKEQLPKNLFHSTGFSVIKKNSKENIVIPTFFLVFIGEETLNYKDISENELAFLDESVIIIEFNPKKTLHELYIVPGRWSINQFIEKYCDNCFLEQVFTDMDDIDFTCSF